MSNSNIDSITDKSVNDRPFKPTFENLSTKDTSLHSTCDAVQYCDRHSKYRNIDGTCNNLRKPKYGKSNTPLQRLLKPSYQDGNKRFRFHSFEIICL